MAALENKHPKLSAAWAAAMGRLQTFKLFLFTPIYEQILNEMMT